MTSVVSLAVGSAEEVITHFKNPAAVTVQNDESQNTCVCICVGMCSCARVYTHIRARQTRSKYVILFLDTVQPLLKFKIKFARAVCLPDCPK